MFDITVTAILRNRGKWTQSRELVDLTSKEKGVKQRQAYNILKNALDPQSKYYEKEIIKHIFWDGTVIYGLAEFGPPMMEKQEKGKMLGSEFYSSLVFQFWKERDEVQQLRSQGKVWLAWEKTQDFSKVLLASTRKEQLVKDIQKINEKIGEIEEDKIFGGPERVDKEYESISERFDYGTKCKWHRERCEQTQKRLLYNAIPEIWAKIAAVFSES